MSTNRPHRLALAGAAIAVASALLAGCGSNGSKTTSAGTPTGGDQTASSSVNATGTPVAEKSTPAPAKGGGGKFCQQLAAIAASEADTNPSGDDTSDDVKKAAQEYQAIKGPILKSAPAEIKPDLTTLFSYLDQLYGMLGKVGYDWTKVDPTALANFAGDAQKVQVAGQHLTTYVQQKCGFDLGGASPSS